MTTMRSLVLTEIGRLELITSGAPEPGPGQALIRVALTGICGSDVHGYTGENGRRVPGQVMGHESTGTLAALAPDAVGPGIGSRVTFNPTVACGSCAHCTSGSAHLCPQRRVIGVDPSWPAAFADYLLVPVENLVELPAERPEWVGALVEPLAVGRHAAGRAGIGAGDHVLVMGAGPIGQAAILGVQAEGAGVVVVSEPDPVRRELAQRLGAQAVAPGDLEAVVRDVTGGAGVTATVDAVGIDQTLGDALASTRPGGRIVLVGMGAQRLTVPAYAISTEERTIVGAFCYTDTEFRETAAWAAAHVDRLEALVSEIVPPEGADAAFRRLAEPGSGLSKVLVDFRDS